MARGARRLLQADIALAVTGIAGPSAGRRSEKPIGLTYIGLSAEDIDTCERHIFQGNRSENKQQSAEAALDLLKRYLERRAELPKLQQIIDRVDPAGAPQLVIVQEADAGIIPSAIRNSQSAIRKRLGMLSSAFNPLTRAHIRMAELAMEAYQLDEVMFELPKVNVDKMVYGTSLAERLWMLKRFISSRPRFSLAMCSHGRFIDKSRAIRGTYPAGIELYFIVGYDTLVRVFDPKYYHNPDVELNELFGYGQFIVANRGEQSPADVRAFLEQPACRPFASKVHLIELDAFHAGLSSSQVREHWARGEPVNGLVADEILPLIPLTALAGQ
jgi:nicotinamide-nucleotide adenylyltransferase